MNNLPKTIAVLLVLHILTGLHLEAQTFASKMPRPAGYTYVEGRALSANGAIVVGVVGSSSSSTSTHRPFKWSSQSGFTILDFPGVATDISADGSVVVGYQYGFSTSTNSYVTYPFLSSRAFVWNSEGIQKLEEGSRFKGISGNGKVAVGSRMDPVWKAYRIAAVWTESGGLRYMVDEEHWTDSEAEAASYTGDKIVGRSIIWSSYEGNHAPLLWNGPGDKNPSYGPIHGAAFGISPNGNWIAGTIGSFRFAPWPETIAPYYDGHLAGWKRNFQGRLPLATKWRSVGLSRFYYTNRGSYARAASNTGIFVGFCAPLDSDNNGSVESNQGGGLYWHNTGSAQNLAYILRNEFQLSHTPWFDETVDITPDGSVILAVTSSDTYLVYRAVSKISLHALNPSGQISQSSDNQDSPILVNPSNLANHTRPIKKGLVADEVTPILFQIKTLAQDQSVIPATIEYVTYRNGQEVPNTFGSKTWVLENGQFVNKPTFTPNQGTTWAYLSHVTFSEIAGSPTHVDVRLVQGENILSIASFEIIAPPIVLVEPYRDRALTNVKALFPTWSDEFLATLAQDTQGEPTRHIIPLQGRRGKPPTNFLAYAQLLNLDLINQVDAQLNPEWAWTRYDIAGFGSAGVTLRYLCLALSQGGIPPFRNPGNAYRGRFRKIATVGTPHRGSPYAYLISQRLSSESEPVNFQEAGEGFVITKGLNTFLDMTVGRGPRWGITLAKWMGQAGNTVYRTLLSAYRDPLLDPWGEAITQANSVSFSTSHHARFRLFSTTIDQGTSYQPSPSQRFLGLGHYQTLFPFGSDGLVGRESQEARSTQGQAPTQHIAPDQKIFQYRLPSFDNQNQTVQTESLQVAESLREFFLNDPDYAAGAFQQPDPLPESLRQELLTLLPNIIPEIQEGDYLQPEGEPTLNPDDGWVQKRFKFNPPQGTQVQKPTIEPEVTFYGNSGTPWRNRVRITRSQEEILVEYDPELQGDLAIRVFALTGDGEILYSNILQINEIPEGVELTRIELQLETTSPQVGTIYTPTVIGYFSDNTTREIFVDPDQITFSTSQPEALTISPGAIVLREVANAQISANYQGFQSQISLQLQPPRVAPPKTPKIDLDQPRRVRITSRQTLKLSGEISQFSSAQIQRNQIRVRVRDREAKVRTRVKPNGKFIIRVSKFSKPRTVVKIFYLEETHKAVKSVKVTRRD